MKKTTQKIVIATVMCLFSLVAGFSATIAWFSFNTSVAASGFTMKIARVGSLIDTISFHEFVGYSDDERSAYGFNPTPAGRITVDSSNLIATYSGAGYPTMANFSMDEPSNPLLMILKAKGSGIEKITAVTEFPYIADQEPQSVDYTVATYGALNPSSYSDGDLIKVESDSNHNNGATVYQYNVPATGDPYYTLYWMGLTIGGTHPLSSIVEFHSFSFNYNPATTNLSSGDVYDYAGSIEGNCSYIPISSSGFTSANRTSFISFSGSSTVFENDVDVFNDVTSDNTYIGIVIDYNVDSLAYIYGHFLGSEVLDEDLAFACDWTMVL